VAKVRKKSGELQEFDRRKLEASIRHAGASEEVAKRVAERIQPTGEISSSELRHRVSQELRRENEALSGAYSSTRRLRAKTDSSLAAGIVRMHEELLKEHGLSPGKKAHIEHETKKAEVRVELAKGARPAEIHMSKSDLDKLGASDGSRVRIRFEH